MKNPSVLSFRALIPQATPADNPVKVTVNAMSRLLRKITIHFVSIAAAGTQHVFSDIGFRVKNRGVLLFPESGSKDQGYTLTSSEEGWIVCPVTTPVEIDLMDGYELSGPPYELTFEFYNTEAHDHEAGGFVVLTEPVTTLQDFIREIIAWREKLEEDRKNPRRDLNVSQYIKK